MQDIDLAEFRRRLRRAAQGSTTNFASFDSRRQINWGLETRRPGGDYYWDGLKRGASAQQPQLLFQYTLEGRGEYAEGGKLWALLPGYGFTVLLPSDHQYYVPDNSNSWTFFWLVIQHSFVTDRIGLLREQEPAVQEWPMGSAALESAAALFTAGCAGKLREVWNFEELLFSWLLETERELHHRRYPRNERQRLLDETRRLVLERLRRPLSTVELADLHRLERTTFSRQFKSKTGLAPAAFVMEVRLNEALKLLRSEAKLEEVAAQTGFADANHFCKVFRRHFHSSPGIYRRMVLKQ